MLSGKATTIPKTQAGVAESVRAVLVARRSAVKARTQAINQVKALLISAPQPLRERLWRNKPAECIAGCMRLRKKATHPLQALTATLRLLAKRWLLLLDREVNALDAMLKCLTQLHAKRLRSRFGIGPQTAAPPLAVAGDKPERLRNEAALAALCGGEPVASLIRQNHSSSAEPRRRPFRQQRPTDYRPSTDAW